MFSLQIPWICLLKICFSETEDWTWFSNLLFCMRILVNHGKEVYIPEVVLTQTAITTILCTAKHKTQLQKYLFLSMTQLLAAAVSCTENCSCFSHIPALISRIMHFPLSFLFQDKFAVEDKVTWYIFPCADDRVGVAAVWMLTDERLTFKMFHTYR